jgi:Ni/Co efflux regulator RcnB
MMLRDGAAEIPALFDSAVKAVRSRSIPLAKLTRSEELSESVDEYRRRVEAGERSRSPSYEAVIASGRAFQRGDRVSFYIRRRIDGEKKRDPLYKRAKLANPDDGVRDEDVEFYIEKLEDVAAQFDEFAPRN